MFHIVAPFDAVRAARFSRAQTETILAQLVDNQPPKTNLGPPLPRQDTLEATRGDNLTAPCYACCVE